MPKPSKQIIIDAIIKEIESGRATEKICAVICRKFQFSQRTFYNHHKKAVIQHTAKQEALKKELAEIDKQAAIEARKKAIMTVEERKVWLSALIQKKTKVMKVGGSTQMVYEYLDENGKLQSEILNTELKLKAIAELNKMEGDYAPTKSDVNVNGFLDFLKETSHES